MIVFESRARRQERSAEVAGEGVVVEGKGREFERKEWRMALLLKVVAAVVEGESFCRGRGVRDIGSKKVRKKGYRDWR